MYSSAGEEPPPAARNYYRAHLPAILGGSLVDDDAIVLAHVTVRTDNDNVSPAHTKERSLY
jgi:hypothetical protein